MNVEQISSIEQFKSIAGAALSPGTAETWNQLGSKFQSAIDSMSRFQQGLSSDSGNLEQSLQGAAGDSFQAYATNTVLKRSQAVTQAISGYPQAMRAIGESIAAFQARVAEIEAESDARMTKRAGDVAKLVAAGTKLGIEVDGNALMAKSRKKDLETVVLPALRRALLDLGASYESNGGSLAGFDASAIQAPDTSGGPGNGGQAQVGGHPGGAEQATEPAQDGHGIGENTGGGADSGTGAAEDAGAGAGGTTGTDAAGGNSDTGAGEGAGGGESTDTGEGTGGGAGGSETASAGAAGGGDGAGAGGTGGGTGAGEGAGGTGGGTGAGEGAGGGTGTDAGAGGGTGAGAGMGTGAGGSAGGGTGKGGGQGGGTGAGAGAGAGAGKGTGKPATTSGQPAEDPARQKALEDARAAAGRAIDDLKKKSPQAGTSAAADTRRAALDDAKKALETAIDGLTGGDRTGTGAADGLANGKQPTTSAEGPAGAKGDKTGTSTVDPAREKALSEAKKAASDAISELRKGTSADSSGSAGDKGGSGLGKGAADSCSTGGAGGSSSGGKDGPNPAREQALADAKKTAGDAISALQGGSGDSGKSGGGKLPATTSQLSQSLAAGGQGPDAAQPKGDPEARRQVQNAINALQAGSGGGPATTSGGGVGPGHGGSPAAPQSATGQDARQLGEDARRTAQRAIDGLLAGEEVPGKGQPTSPLAGFLSGTGGHSGGPGGVPGGGGHGPRIGGAVGGSSLDGVTRNPAAEAAAVARQGGYEVPGAQPGALPGSHRGAGGSPGTDMGGGGVPPGMMGAGGAGVAGRHREEREHTTWLHAEDKDWQEGDTEASSPRIGRGDR